MKAVDKDEAREILATAHQRLAEHESIQASRRGVIGWCFGGGLALRHAIAADDLDAAVVYYGRLVTDPKTLAKIEAPLLGVFGNRDESIPPDLVQAFETALDEAGVPHEILQYDADHAFANPSGNRYEQEPAAEAWKATRAFLAEHLKES